jgi:hypothetical protein
MEKLTSLSDLEDLAARIRETDSLIQSDECKQKETNAREAYARQVGFWGHFFGFEASQTATACPVRDEIYTRLPEEPSVSPTVAFFLAADHQTFMSAMAEVQNAYDSAAGSNFTGMAVDLAASTVKPRRLINLGVKVLQSWSIMFKHMSGSDRAIENRDKLASCILTVYKLTENPRDTYVLKRGKWGVDSLYGAYTSTHWLKMKENGVDTGFDFQKLKSRIDLGTE